MYRSVLRPSPRRLEPGHPEPQIEQGMIERPDNQNFITFIDHHIISTQRSPACKIINSISLKARLKACLTWPPGCQHGRQCTVDSSPGNHSAAYVVIGAMIYLDYINFHMQASGHCSASSVGKVRAIQ
jgi:hypothetical protein